MPDPVELLSANDKRDARQIDPGRVVDQQLGKRRGGQSRRAFGENRSVVYHVTDGTGLAMLSDGSADAAFSYGVFVHLQHWDIFTYLTELERVLRPGGKAIIPHANTFSELGWKRFRSEVPRQLNRHKLHWTFTVNSPQLMAELVRRAGLEPVEMVTNVAKRDCIALIRKPQ